MVGWISAVASGVSSSGSAGLSSAGLSSSGPAIFAVGRGRRGLRSVEKSQVFARGR